MRAAFCAARERARRRGAVRRSAPGGRARASTRRSGLRASARRSSPASARETPLRFGRGPCARRSPLSRASPSTSSRLRRPELHAGAPRLRKADRDGLLRRARAVLAFADVMDLFADELARLRARRLPGPLVLPGSSGFLDRACDMPPLRAARGASRMPRGTPMRVAHALTARERRFYSRQFARQSGLQGCAATVRDLERLRSVAEPVVRAVVLDLPAGSRKVRSCASAAGMKRLASVRVAASVRRLEVRERRKERVVARGPWGRTRPCRRRCTRSRAGRRLLHAGEVASSRSRLRSAGRASRPRAASRGSRRPGRAAPTAMRICFAGVPGSGSLDDVRRVAGGLAASPRSRGAPGCRSPAPCGSGFTTSRNSWNGRKGVARCRSSEKLIAPTSIASFGTSGVSAANIRPMMPPRLAPK